MASIVVSGDTSGAVTITAPAIAGTTTLTLPTTSGTIVTTAGATTVQFAAGSAASPSITFTGDTNTGIFSPAADTIAFTEGGVESMRIDSSGNVGIGTSSPSSALHVSRSSGESVVQITNSGSGASWVHFAPTSGAAYLHNTGNTPMIFTTNGTERMRIDSSGNVLYNCTGLTNDAPNGNGRINQTNGNEKVRVAADTQVAFQFYSPSGGTSSPVGTITVNASSVGFNTTSDYRLKENITPMTGALDKVSQLKPCTYTWKSTGEQGQGFIAHELQAVIPDAVSGEKDAVNEEGNPVHQGVDTSFLVATLTAAIQEQQQIINDLKARIETLEGAK